MVQVKRNALNAKKLKKPFGYGSSSETLTEMMLKAVIAGYGGYSECCYCTYTIEYLDEGGGSSTDEGLVCGNFGDNGCYNGITRLWTSINGMEAELSNLCCQS